MVKSAAQTETPLFLYLVRHPIGALLALNLGLSVFGILTLNLAHYFLANADYLLAYGLPAQRYGGRRLADLLAKSLAASIAFAAFKLSEGALMERLAYGRRRLSHEQP